MVADRQRDIDETNQPTGAGGRQQDLARGGDPAAYPLRVSPSRVRIGVLAIQGDVREHIHALSTLDVHATGVRRSRELDDVDALVIPGGESTTMDKLVRAFDLQEPLRKRIAGGMPAYGACAGMIMLADRVADARPDQETLGDWTSPSGATPSGVRWTPSRRTCTSRESLR